MHSADTGCWPAASQSVRHAGGTTTSRITSSNSRHFGRSCDDSNSICQQQSDAKGPLCERHVYMSGRCGTVCGLNVLECHLSESGFCMHVMLQPRYKVFLSARMWIQGARTAASLVWCWDYLVACGLAMPASSTFCRHAPFSYAQASVHHNVPLQEICKNPKAVDWMLTQMRAAGKSAGLKGLEDVKAIHLAAEQFRYEWTA